MYKITCPYCFGEPFDDTAVHFRSEFVNKIEIDEISDSKQKKEATAFSPRISEKYRNWWTVNDVFSTSEKDPAAGDIEPFYRPVIDPADPRWQPYLVPLGVGNTYDTRFLGRDRDGMVSFIKIQGDLHEEMICSRRVCPHCHNPLPENFGKTPIITIPIIGVTGSGKTVYMSSLLSKISGYMTKVGYTGAISTGGVFAFQESNKVAQGCELPAPTAATLVQQPLCFTMNRPLPGNKLSTYTVVLYDLAGEYFKRDAKYNIHLETKHRKPLLKHANGIILLIDPKQLTGIAEDNTIPTDNLAVTALDTIQNVLHDGGQMSSKVDVPIAICIPKADSELFSNIFGMDIQMLATQSADYDVHSKRIPADQYNELNDRLYENMEYSGNGVFAQAGNYEMFRFFAFSAVSGDLIQNGKLIGRPFPQRIEDPLLWLFAKNGYCEVDGRLHHDVNCPNCNSYWTRYEELVVPGERKCFKKLPDEHYNHVCKKCGKRFNSDNG